MTGAPCVGKRPNRFFNKTLSFEYLSSGENRAAIAHNRFSFNERIKLTKKHKMVYKEARLTWMGRFSGCPKR